MTYSNFHREFLAEIENQDPDKKTGPTIFQHFRLADISRFYRKILGECLVKCRPESREAGAILQAIAELDFLKNAMDNHVVKKIPAAIDPENATVKIYYGPALSGAERHRLVVRIAAHFDVPLWLQ